MSGEYDKRCVPVNVLSNRFPLRSVCTLRYSEVMPKMIRLTKGHSTMVDDGDFSVLSRDKWHAVISRHNVYAKNIKHGYLHRHLMNPKSGYVVDHVDCNTLNNTRKNLRICTPEQNNWNTKRKLPSYSGYIGVGYKPKCSTRPWKVKITLHGKVYHLGSYCTSEEAAIAYDVAAQICRGEFATTNFPVNKSSPSA